MARTSSFGFFSLAAVAALPVFIVVAFRDTGERLHRLLIEPFLLAFPPPAFRVPRDTEPAPARVLFRDQVRAFTERRLARFEPHSRAPLSMAFAGC